mmetsp:Transcript_19267/g.32174  ORF Transcript_19267/g.32174 Transcript_19267/m.32174 type:complete len:928 (-) Transcript_19267:1082-3865(-)
MSVYQGGNVSEKLDAITSKHGVVVLSKSHCPFCLEVKKTFKTMGVPIHVIEVNMIQDGAEVMKVAKEKTNHKTWPSVFIKGTHYGGCDDVKKLEASGELFQLVQDLVDRQDVLYASQLETIQFAKEERGNATNPLFLFPATVNNNVIRGTGVIVCLFCILGIVFRDEVWGRWIVAYLLFDFTTRFLVGGSMSVFSQLANLLTCWMKPDFKPGAPKQFASLCGTMFSLVAVCCLFTGHPIPGAVVLGLLLGAAFLEGFVGFCVGCLFFGLGVQFGIFPDYVYRIYANTREETAAAYDYLHDDFGAQAPEFVDTDPTSKIALKYKRKVAEWSKDDFNLVKHMQVTYFAAPLALAGLATAFKLASAWLGEWVSTFGQSGLGLSQMNVSNTWYYTFAVIAAVVYVFFLALYITRAVMYTKKIRKEWQCPLRGSAFGMITICCMLFGFLVYDLTDVRFGRTLWWVGAIPHMVLTIMKFGELIGKRLELEHVQISWMILPVGNLVAAMIAPIIPVLGNLGLFASVELAKFFYAFAFFMWIVLFTITFFKVVTTHNSDDRLRSLCFIWVAAPCVVGLADFVICASENSMTLEAVKNCGSNFNLYYYLGIVIFLGLVWAFMPYIGFFGRNKFDMSHWNFIFPLDTLAACGSLYYSVTGFKIGQGLMVIFIWVATVATALAALNTLICLVKRRGLFTPFWKWGPLSFMKLTHDAVREAIPTLKGALDGVDLDRKETLHRFAAFYSQFAILHEEHAKHEDEVVFKQFNDMFHQHAKKYNDDHEEDRELLTKWQMDINCLLDDTTDRESKDIVVSKLREEIPSFLEHFLEHLDGEEFNLNPIGRKYVPVSVQTELSRKVFAITPAERWEVIIPYIVKNLPRHKQRVTYLKCLTWSQPERTQQIGAIVYRNVDSVMWERLRADFPDIIPRGEFNHWRYY